MGKDIKELIKESHDTAVEKGWWDDPRTFLECIALCHSELSEAVEYYRRDGVTPFKQQKDDLTVELADVLIRIFDMCGYYNLDLPSALEYKLEYNKSRPYRHGNKKA